METEVQRPWGGKLSREVQTAMWPEQEVRRADRKLGLSGVSGSSSEGNQRFNRTLGLSGGVFLVSVVLPGCGCAQSSPFPGRPIRRHTEPGPFQTRSITPGAFQPTAQPVPENPPGGPGTPLIYLFLTAP